MKKALMRVVLGIAMLGGIAAARAQIQPVWVHRVWDAAPHNAFTDLLRFQSSWYLVFREGPVHGVPDVGAPGGKIRVLRSKDAERWDSLALLDYGPDQDLRDPKISVAPDGSLMIHAAVAPHARNKFRQSLAYRSTDGGKTWAAPVSTGDPDLWMWRVTWGPDSKAYGVGYGPMSTLPGTTRLYRSDDGLHFTILVATLTSQSGTGETTLRFLPNGQAVALVRRDFPQDQRGLVGMAPAPYTSWTFHELPERIGGPNFIVLPDGRLVAAVRRIAPDDSRTTILAWLEPHTGKLDAFLTLPSRGDTSYAGLVWHEGFLWVSYYSTHEEKTSIYLAKVRLPKAGAAR